MGKRHRAKLRVGHALGTSAACPARRRELGVFRSLGAPRWSAALGVAAMCALPVVTHYQGNGANTDLPAITWLVAATQLALGARRHPALLAPALLAAGLAVGTKTTTAPLILVVIGLAAYSSRASLGRLALPIAAATAAAIGVGGYWYLRNFVDHGSPLWPFVAAPWGDPVPATLGPPGVDSSLLDRPGETLRRVGDDWLELCGSGFLLIAGAMVAAITSRARATVAAAAAAAGATLLWANAPVTGVSTPFLDVVTASTVRYLLPAVAAAILALVLATTSERRSARVAGATFLGAGVALGVIQTADLGFPLVPSLTTLLAGAAAGVVAALAVGHRTGPHPRIAGALAGGGLVVALTLAASGWTARHAESSVTPGFDTIGWLASQSEFDDGDGPIAGAPIVQGTMAGDRLQHDLAWVRADEPCPRVRDLARRGYVVFYMPAGFAAAPAIRCLRGASPRHKGRDFLIYGPRPPMG